MFPHYFIWPAVNCVPADSAFTGTNSFLTNCNEMFTLSMETAVRALRHSRIVYYVTFSTSVPPLAALIAGRGTRRNLAREQMWSVCLVGGRLVIPAGALAGLHWLVRARLTDAHQSDAVWRPFLLPPAEGSVQIYRPVLPNTHIPEGGSQTWDLKPHGWFCLVENTPSHTSQEEKVTGVCREVNTHFSTVRKTLTEKQKCQIFLRLRWIFCCCGCEEYLCTQQACLNEIYVHTASQKFGHTFLCNFYLYDVPQCRYILKTSM